MSADMILDANNHLLNSLFGTIADRLFGENWFFFRLPNLLAFILYFFSVVALLRPLKKSSLRLLALFALVCCPYYLEYFAYTRGYGLSMGLFAFALLQLFLFVETHKKHHFVFLWLSMVLAVSANLTLVNTYLILLGLLFLFPLIIESAKPLKNFIWKNLLVAIVALLPFIAFGIILKEAGALYYGGKEGLWEHTGRTLMKYIFFWSDQYARIFLNVLVGLALVFTIIRFVKQKLTFAFSRQGILLLIIFGNLSAIVILARFLGVNYPEDRTVMYFLPVGLLFLAYLYDRYWPVGKFTQVAFLFFPVTLLFNLSLHTSVFSPDDRMTNEFYKKVKSELKPQHSISIYGIMAWNWPRHESHSTIKASTPNLINTNLPLTDIIVSKTTIINNPQIAELYDTIAHDPASTYVAFKRKQAIERSFVKRSENFHAEGPLEYANLWFYDFPDTLQHRPLQVSVSGHLKSELKKHTLQLVVQTFDSLGQQIERLYYPFEVLHQRSLIDEAFLHHFVLPASDQHIKELRVYFWNRWHGPFTLANAQCELYELKNTGLAQTSKN